MIHVGIDPGASGGIAVLDDFGLDVQPMPDRDEKVAARLFNILTVAQDRATVVVEDVHAMPRKGARPCVVCGQVPTPGIASTGKFLRGYGVLRGSIMALAMSFPIRAEFVSPRTWQRWFEVPTSGTSKAQSEAQRQELQRAHKARLHEIAAGLFPAVRFRRDQADAVLLAVFGREGLR